jgi:hypothetical protein
MSEQKDQLVKSERVKLFQSTKQQGIKLGLFKDTESSDIELTESGMITAQNKWIKLSMIDRLLYAGLIKGQIEHCRVKQGGQGTT